MGLYSLRMTRIIYVSKRMVLVIKFSAGREGSEGSFSRREIMQTQALAYCQKQEWGESMNTKSTT